MRHALVNMQLIQEARAAADAEADERHARQAPADPRPDPDPSPGRFAALARRLRARTHVRAPGVRAETPGGGA
jgi:hypothetical protein